jgi:hypothetical protein
MFNRKKKILEDLRNTWGHFVDRKRDLDRIALFHRLACNRDSTESIDERTSLDLDLADCFTNMDRATTPLGSQFIYHLLHTYRSDEKVLAQQTMMYEVFQSDAGLRETVQLLLTQLTNKNAYFLPNVFLREIPDRPTWYPVIYVLSALSFVSVAVTFFYPPALWLALGVVLINLVLDHQYGNRLAGFFIDLSTLGDLLRVAGQLSREKTPNSMVPFAWLRNNQALIRSLQKRIGWLTINEGRLDILTAAVVQYLNQFCLFRLVAWMRANYSIKHHQLEIRQIFEAVATLDACIAIASYLHETQEFCVPEFNDSGLLDIASVRHPLVSNPISNSIVLNRKSCLITASNMAGKTTFAKALGVNVILAQTLHFCLASRANIPRLVVKSSINRLEDISGHKSRYFDEIETILRMINASDRPWHYLFIIDEIFSGTNTVERISAAASVLCFLGRNNLTIVTTHDVELHGFLAQEYEMYHFAEQVVGDDRSFDYLLKPGLCSTRNAIKLLELEGYPGEIIEQANHLADRFSSTDNPVRIGRES